MKLDISDLLNKDNLEEDLHITLDEKSFYDGSEYIGVLNSINFSGVLKKVGDIFLLDGKVNAVLELTCSRCLDKFPYTVNININEKFTDGKNTDENEDDLIFIDDSSIDVTEVIENNIILTLPIKRLCSDDCSGLCPRCGVNLNKSTCSCEKAETDIRWAKLKDMFSDD
jgi:uncharacterized protein